MNPEILGSGEESLDSFRVKSMKYWDSIMVMFWLK